MPVANKIVVVACWIGVIVLQGLSLFIDKLHGPFIFCGMILAISGTVLFILREQENEKRSREQEQRIEIAYKKVEEQNKRLASAARVNAALTTHSAKMSIENSELNKMVSEWGLEIKHLKEKMKPPKLAWNIPAREGDWIKRRALYLVLKEIEEDLGQSPLNLNQAKAILETNEKYMQKNPKTGEVEPVNSTNIEYIRETYLAGKDGFWVDYASDMIRARSEPKRTEKTNSQQIPGKSRKKPSKPR
jgi:hypothetical protein